MKNRTAIRPTPWDTEALEIPAFELLEYSEGALREALQTRGHHTIRVSPLADKGLLHRYGFYYCDTLIQPNCTPSRLRASEHVDATVSQDVDPEQILQISEGAFVHGRFHRDFNLARRHAEKRYGQWLGQLLDSNEVWGLYWQGVLAGFIGCHSNALTLHAVKEQYRGQGLSKYWWSAICVKLFALGYEKVQSSISAANMPVINLYASLGFSFAYPEDVYHRLVP